MPVWVFFLKRIDILILKKKRWFFENSYGFQLHSENLDSFSQSSNFYDNKKFMILSILHLVQNWPWRIDKNTFLNNHRILMTDFFFQKNWAKKNWILFFCSPNSFVFFSLGLTQFSINSFGFFKKFSIFAKNSTQFSILSKFNSFFCQKAINAGSSLTCS